MSANVGSDTIVTNGLVFYLDSANYKSYTSGSTTWRDLTINGNNGTLINGPAFNSGNAGSIVFDGVDDYGTFPNLGGLSKFTVEAWFNPFAYPSGGSHPAVVSNTWDGNNVNFVIGWSFISTNTIFVGFLNGSTGEFWRTINDITVDLNKNVSVTMTFADNLMVAYKNGSFFNS